MHYKDFKYETCSKCKNEVLIEDSNFCNICCFDLRNLCSNANCINRNGPSLPKNSRFCHLCGHKTTYLINDLLNDWENEDFSSDNSLIDKSVQENIKDIIKDIAISDIDVNNI